MRFTKLLRRIVSVSLFQPMFVALFTLAVAPVAQMTTKADAFISRVFVGATYADGFVFQRASSLSRFSSDKSMFFSHSYFPCVPDNFLPAPLIGSAQNSPPCSSSMVTFSHMSGNSNAPQRLIRNKTTQSKKDASDISGENSAASCGERNSFSTSFPRYRIDLSTSVGKAGQGAGNPIVSKQSSFLSGLRQKLDRARVENAFRAQVQAGTFQWVDCAGGSGDLNMEQRPRGDVSATAASGIRALAVFWRTISDLLLVDLDGIEQCFAPQENVLALWGASALTAKRMVEIHRWMQTAEKNGVIGSKTRRNVGMRRIDVTLDEEMPVPVIVLKRRGLSPNEAGTSTADSRERNQPLSLESDVVEKRIKCWVRRILVNLEICPFTKSDTKSGHGLGHLGVPVAKIAYHTSFARQDQVPTLLADTWEAILEMILAGPRGRNGVSSILLAAPHYDDDFPLWAGPIFALLEACVSAARAEPVVGVVCFHPTYRTPDGTSWPGFGHMHSMPRLRGWLDQHDPSLSNELTDNEVAAGGAWQRRTPHAVINVLRAEQLEVAESRRVTGTLYARNIRKLVGKEGVGSDKLAAALSKEREST